MPNNNSQFIAAAAAVSAMTAVILAAGSFGSAARAAEHSEGPKTAIPPKHEQGDESRGREVFRFETFGNEGFWTDAVRLPKGVTDAGLTPVQALKAGLSVDIEALDAATVEALAAELKTDLSAKNAPLLNDPKTTMKLLEANAVIGMVPKDSNGNGKMDLAGGDKIGTSCALCHTRTDQSVFSLPTGGSIGKRIDGLATHNINLGVIFAMAANSRALYPTLQLALTANKGKSIGRAPYGLTENSSEAEVDAYLKNPKFYPVGMFDDSFDGNGDPMHNTPLFRQDLAFPYGSEGAIAKLDDFSNLVYTALFDQTTLTTPGGRAFLKKLGGPAGEEIADDYVKVLAATGVTGYPYVKAMPLSDPNGQKAPVGIRVDEQKLIDMNAYLFGLAAPKGEPGDAKAVARGRELFMSSGCTSCHNVDQNRFVPSGVLAMKLVVPSDNPKVLAQREPPLNPVMNSAGLFDDKMVIVNASMRGDIRGVALPLLLDLASKPVFLHDNSVPSLERLLNPARGRNVPHPFYLSKSAQRADVVMFLKSLETAGR